MKAIVIMQKLRYYYLLHLWTRGLPIEIHDIHHLPTIELYTIPPFHHPTTPKMKTTIDPSLVKSLKSL
jgi:hypothetical protein